MTTIDQIHCYQELSAQIAADRRACGLTVPVHVPPSPMAAQIQVADLGLLVLTQAIPLLEAVDTFSTQLRLAFGLTAVSEIDVGALTLHLQDAVSRAATATGLPACQYDYDVDDSPDR